MSPADNSRSFNSTELFGHGAELLRIWQEVALPGLARHGPLFTGKLKALLETVRRMELWMESMQLFKDPSHHQAAAAGARALFELVLDVKALAADTDGLMLEKFEAFPEVEHFRVSQKLVAFYRRPGQTASLKDFAERAAYVDDTARRDRIYETCRKLWGRDPAKDPIRGWPKHWTNQGTDQRSRGFGPAFEEHHVLSFAKLSLYLHSGAAGSSTGPQNEEALIALSHAIAVQSFLSALVALADELTLTELKTAIEKWAQRWHRPTL